jgi:PelA/Pel-15E family pectate lyase
VNRSPMFAVLLSLACAVPAAADDKPLGPTEARKKVGEKVTVEMTVRAAKDRLEKRGEIYLDSETDFRDEKNFAVVITKPGAASLKEAGIDDPAEHFQDKLIRATGTVKEADGVPRIEIDDAKQIKRVEKELRKQAADGLRRAVEFFRKHVSAEGSYLWRYSEDLARREGEAKATATQAWVQPPGTPTVGLAYLAAFEATGDAYYGDAVRETAHALVRGQLRSGGWDYRIEFDPKQRGGYAYRVDGGGEKGKNVTTLDDNTTQAALRFLMRADKKLGKDDRLRDAVRFGLESLLKAQYPNGAWPQRFDAFPDPTKFPAKRASYPEAWSRTWPGKDYRAYYTLNDNTLADVIDVLLEASRAYGDGRYRAAALKGGDFLILAQMPEPQPGWAQQYDADMHPAWARKFEPPAITGAESMGAMLTLLRLYRETGDNKYLEPLPRALEYYRKSETAPGRLARFYELKTNKPLYFTKTYELTYRDDDVPTHYGFKVGSRVEPIAKEHQRLKKLSTEELQKPAPPERPRVTEATANRVQEVLKAQDEKGRWVENGTLRHHGPDDPTRRIIDCQTFARNVELLSAYLRASR